MQSENIFYENISFSDATNVRFCTLVDKGSYTPNHWHRAIEILYILEGELLMTMEGKNILLKQGQCILVNANVIHANKSTTYNKFILLQIPTEFINKFINYHQTVFILNHDIDTVQNQRRICRIKNLLKQMKYINESNLEGKLLYFNNLLFKLLCILQRHFSVHIGDTKIKQQNKELERLNTVLEYTIQNYAKSISLAEIAKIAIFQPKYFCRFFKKHMGISFLVYQNELRISYIYRDLLNTNDSIAEILERHGFTNYKLFMRMFKEKFGDTPINIRKAVNKSKL